MRRITVETEPEAEPLLMADVKTYLKLDTDADDDLITSLIGAARRHVENYLNQKLITQTLKEVLDNWPAFPYQLELGPFQSVSSITYVEEDQNSGTWADSNYYFDADTGRLALTEDGDTPDDDLRDIAGVVIHYVAGYGDAGTSVPDNILNAMKLLIAHWYRNREPVVKGTIVSAVPMTVNCLLDLVRDIPV